MAIAGTRHLFTSGASGTLYTEQRKFYLKEDQVAELYPSVAPFRTLLGRLNLRKTDDVMFKTFEHRSECVDMDFFIGQSQDWNTGSYEGTQTDVVVEKTAGGTDNVGFLTKGDIVEVRAASDSSRARGDHATTTYAVAKNQVVARLLVTLVDNQKLIHVENLSRDGIDSYNIVDQDPASVITHADPEGSISPETWSDDLSVVWGSNQIIKTPLEITGDLMEAVLRGSKKELTRQRAEKAKEHALKEEGMLLKGYMPQYYTSYTGREVVPSFPTDPNTTAKSYSKKWRMSWGMIPLLETFGTANVQVFSRQWANYDLDAFINDMEARSLYFDGEVTEFAFAGAKVLSELSKTGSDSFFARSGGSIALSEWKLTNLGFQVRTLTHPFGTTHIAWAPLLRKAPYNNMMVMVDPKNAFMSQYRQSHYETAIQDNDYDGVKDQYFSQKGLGVDLIERHALWKFN